MICPNYGESITAIPPKDSSWVDKWKKKALIYKLTLGMCAFVFLVVGIALTIFVAIGYGGFIAFLMVVSYLLGISLLILFIIELRIKRMCYKTIDGYSIVYYFGMKHNAIVEDEILDIEPIQYVYPEKKQFVVVLPNKKIVNIDIYRYLKDVRIYEGK